MRTILAAMLAVGLSMGTAHAVDPLPRTGKWIVNYDENRCELVATFGEGEGKVFAKFIRYDLSDGFYLDLIGYPFAINDAEDKIQIGFGPYGPMQRSFPLFAKNDGLPILLFNSIRIDAPYQKIVPFIYGRTKIPDRPPMSDADAARVTRLTVQIGRDRIVVLDLGSMLPPLNALKICTQTLVRHWGFDPAQQATLSRKPEFLGENGWPAITSIQHPSAMKLGRPNRVTLWLDIDENGKMSNCRGVSETNIDDFVAASCDALRKRARFLPALDRDGKPTKSFIVRTVNWDLSS